MGNCPTALSKSKIIEGTLTDMTLSPEKNYQAITVNCCAGMTFFDYNLGNVFFSHPEIVRTAILMDFRGFATINLDSVQGQKLRPPLVPENFGVVMVQVSLKNSILIFDEGHNIELLDCSLNCTFSWSFHLVLCIYLNLCLCNCHWGKKSWIGTKAYVTT